MMRPGKERAASPVADDEDATQVTTQEGRRRAGVNRQSQPDASLHQRAAGLASGAKRLQCTLTSGLPNVSLISGGVEESIESASKTLPLQSALTRLSSRWPQMQLSAMKSCGRISSSDANEPKSIARSSSSKQARLSSRVSGQGGGRLARATWLVGGGLLAARWHGVSSAGSLDALP